MQKKTNNKETMGLKFEIKKNPNKNEIKNIITGNLLIKLTFLLFPKLRYKNKMDPGPVKKYSADAS